MIIKIENKKRFPKPSKGWQRAPKSTGGKALMKQMETVTISKPVRQ